MFYKSCRPTVHGNIMLHLASIMSRYNLFFYDIIVAYCYSVEYLDINVAVFHVVSFFEFVYFDKVMFSKFHIKISTGLVLTLH
jgi:hypothetical protein